ncbi:hypothetical protein A2U01_0067843, partial [Trifolium medium]|nr:hypothetical protein [Trifolium medium]
MMLVVVGWWRRLPMMVVAGRWWLQLAVFEEFESLNMDDANEKS